jgi:HAD superfamily hydrolase (TIGR01662 family)
MCSTPDDWIPEKNRCIRITIPEKIRGTICLSWYDGQCAMQITTDIPLDTLDTSLFSDTIIIVDIDGTLTDTRESYVSPEIHATIQRLKQNNEVYIFSNNLNSTRNHAVAKSLDTPYLNSSCRKPFAGVIKNLSNPQHKKIVAIGDRWLTDGWFAHNIGADFVKVRRITKPSDYFIFKVVYLLDDMLGLIIKLMNRRV